MTNLAEGSQPSGEHTGDSSINDDGSNTTNTPEFGQGAVGDLRSEIRIPPRSRFRRRADGGMDDTYRVHFAGPLDHDEMRRILAALLAFLDKSAQVGIIGLTKVEFPEPDICEYRLWSADARSERLNMEFELLYRLHQIHPIDDVDGIRYPLPRA